MTTLGQPGFFQSMFDEFFMILNPFTFPWSRMIMPMLTLVGAWGGFPDSPKIFKAVTQFRLFQYFFLWVLVMQGGASADPGLSLLAVLIFGIVSEVIKLIEGPQKEEFKNMKDDEAETYGY